MIQVTTNEVKKEVKGFPKLMTSGTGKIILFTSERAGVVLHDPSNGLLVGGVYNSIDISSYKEIEYSVTIQNV